MDRVRYFDSMSGCLIDRDAQHLNDENYNKDDSKRILRQDLSEAIGTKSLPVRTYDLGTNLSVHWR